MSNWTIALGDKVLGPLSDEQAMLAARENPGAWCWQPGMSDWQLVFQNSVIRPMKKDKVTPMPAPPASMMFPKPTALPAQSGAGIPSSSPPSHSPAPAPANQDPTQSSIGHSSAGFGSGQRTDGIDYRIYGHETQYLEVELDQGESAVAEAGAMMYKTGSVEMATIFGDGSGNDSGIMGKLLGAGKRLLTGESLFTTVFTQQEPGKGVVAFAAPFPGTILPLSLADYGGKLICQKDSFLAGSKGVSIGIHFQRKILTGLFGGEGFVLQKLEGSGLAFVHMGGSIRKIELKPGERLDVDTGCLAAMTSSVDFDIRRAGGLKSMLFGGEGVFLATVTGPGTVWLQSLPFSRLAGRMLASAPQGGGERKGEGSILGGLGDIIGGRN
ncbi:MULTISPECIES: TIGR00266 family protein [unclassified Pseudomonas]|uniref:TIGR00266 family protein n=1 Tax=Pseudomonas TaxID=286 RepID=UPI0012978589|nr:MULTISPECIES: TIGR00266 family protein [unclassified Pseudomonas]MQU09740.1 TIGR00266 family protein [Pseudomonas sp. FSL R10-2189]MQU36186.1 TIGR00266 family protein [Pseudomonas sp. FSL R10-2172]